MGVAALKECRPVKEDCRGQEPAQNREQARSPRAAPAALAVGALLGSGRRQVGRTPRSLHRRASPPSRMNLPECRRKPPACTPQAAERVWLAGLV
jgi:hypothetical protein